MSRFRAYYLLTKPGIIRGNAVNAIAGFLLASTIAIFDFGVFVAMLSGLSLIIASGCVFNNYIDRDIDKKMKRTKKRALVTGDISAQNALVYATALGLAGATILGLFTNILTLVMGLMGFVFYVVVYGIGKRKTVHGTVIGSISGAIPPVVGYTSVSNTLDGGALLLFFILVLWQVPHFYAIAMYRLKDYSAAGIPVLPAVKSMSAAKIQTLIYIVAFTIACIGLTTFGYTGILYAIIMAIAGTGWFIMGLKGYNKNDIAWAHRMFGFSLIVTLTFCTAILIDFLIRS